MSDKHPEFIVRQAEPLNGGPPPRWITQSPITPTELFFVRNHAPVPRVDPAAYRLRVTGLVDRPLSLSLDEWEEDFPRVELEATLQCAGNRRGDLMDVKPIPGEVRWEEEAISHAVWTGVPLAELLERAGVQAGARHVACSGLDRVQKGGQTFGLGGSIPLEKALAGEVLLAEGMNGAPLPPAHGAPLRLVVPGYIGARSVKWLQTITVQREPSDNFYQARAYRLFPPDVDADRVVWERGLMLGELSVNAAICAPRDGETLPAGPMAVRGYATAGGRRTVERVDLSGDGGHSWVQADLSARKPWSWRLWRAKLELAPGEHLLVARAWDSAANTQPEDSAQIWNFKGYMSNAWHRVRLTVQP